MTSNISKTLKEEHDRAITEGQSKLLIKQLIKKFREIPLVTSNKIKSLSEAKIELIGENIFDISSLEELDKYLN